MSGILMMVIAIVVLGGAYLLYGREMTPTSVGGEQQNYISGGIQSPI